MHTKIWTIVVVGIALAACTTTQDPAFGDSVRAMRAAQTLNPEASDTVKMSYGSDPDYLDISLELHRLYHYTPWQVDVGVELIPQSADPE